MTALLTLLGLCLPIVTLGYLLRCASSPVGAMRPVPPRRREPDLPGL